MFFYKGNFFDELDKRAEQIRENSKSCRDVIISYLEVVKRFSGRFDEIRTELNRLNKDRNREEIILGLLADKYKNGTVIIWDEQNPRSLICYKNGKNMMGDRTNQVYFTWDYGEFPNLEINN